MEQQSLRPDGFLGPRSEHGGPNEQPERTARTRGPRHPLLKRQINPPRHSSGRSSHGGRCRCLAFGAWWGGRVQCSRRVHAGF